MVETGERRGSENEVEKKETKVWSFLRWRKSPPYDSSEGRIDGLDHYSR
tara:strand:- start:2407 stop:2553 length:147 start_codon:yes stop_codon:yes gene_type:complete